MDKKEFLAPATAFIKTLCVCAIWLLGYWETKDITVEDIYGVHTNDVGQVLTLLDQYNDALCWQQQHCQFASILHH